ncbi:hypothetical protein DEDE109153_06630 [Deinococcus deserti]
MEAGHVAAAHVMRHTAGLQGQLTLDMASKPGIRERNS